MKNKLINFSFALVLLPLASMAQSFMPAYKATPGKIHAIVVDQKGDSIRGVVTWLNHDTNIKGITIKDDKDVKHKFEEQDIKVVLATLKDADKMTMLTDQRSLKAMSQSDPNQVAKAEYFIWEPAVTPKKGKLMVLQLVNHGFDSRLKIYRDPTAGETGGIGISGLQLTGGVEKSYYLVKTGEEVAILMEKGDYKQQFFDVFVKSCPDMEKLLEGKKPDWDDFSKHVFAYELTCKN